VTDAGGPALKSRQRKTEKHLTCFVASPSFVDVEPILEVLKQRRIKGILPGTSSSTTATFADSVSDQIRKSDFVLAYLAPRASESVYYEIGAATALGKRSLLVVDPGFRELPTDFGGFLHVRAKLSETNSIGFALDQMLSKSGFGKPKTRRVLKKTRPIGKLADELISILRNLEGQTSEEEVSRVVMRALEASGIAVHANPTSSDLGVDFAVWADELNDWVGNPLLVEVKSDLADSNRLSITRRQIETYLAQTNARWALLLCLRGPASTATAERTRFQTILVMNVYDLVENLRRHSFARVIRDARNRVVHGTGS
jgi:nucleoside 2-deoxyribosyltransferase